MKKTQTTAIIVVSTLVLGYFVGAVVGVPVSDGLLSGDIGKASKAQKEVIAKSNEAFVNKVRNDQAYSEELKSMLTYITIVAGDYKLNAELTESATASIPEFAKSNAEMVKLKEISNNVYDLSVQTFAAINDTEGQSDGNLEQLYNNTLSSFMLLENSLTFVKNFAIEADTYIASNKASSDLTFVRDLWVDHLIVNAIVYDDKMSYKALAKLGNQTSDEEIEKKLLALNDEQKFQKGFSDAMRSSIVTSVRNIDAASLNVLPNDIFSNLDFKGLGNAAELIGCGMLQGVNTNELAAGQSAAGLAANLQTAQLAGIEIYFNNINPAGLGQRIQNEVLGMLNSPQQMGFAQDGRSLGTIVGQKPVQF